MVHSPKYKKTSIGNQGIGERVLEYPGKENKVDGWESEKRSAVRVG